MPSPPENTVSELERYDPLLRLRWGIHSELWVIERKMPRRHPDFVKSMPSPWKSVKGLDIWDGWKDGYLHVMFAHPSLIQNHQLILQALAGADIWRVGGREELNRKLDEAEIKVEASVDRNIDNYIEAAVSESYDMLQWRLGNRFAMTEPIEQFEQHEGFVVRVKTSELREAAYGAQIQMEAVS